jgi:Type IIA topoisomerase (DNA gyrase/topo II, topoisomerase IV), B subunit
MMWMTTMNPATRRLINVLPNENIKTTSDAFELLLGDNLDGRKEHIAENGWRYLELAEFS